MVFFAFRQRLKKRCYAVAASVEENVPKTNYRHGKLLFDPRGCARVHVYLLYFCLSRSYTSTVYYNILTQYIRINSYMSNIWLCFLPPLSPWTFVEIYSLTFNPFNVTHYYIIMYRIKDSTRCTVTP